MEDLLDLPLICSRQGMTAGYPKLFREKLDTLHAAATFTPMYNGWCTKGLAMPSALTVWPIPDRTATCLMPILTTKMCVVWKKYQMFSRAAG